MSKMPCYATIPELIDQIKRRDISYRNMHTPVYIQYTERLTGEKDTYVIPYKAITMDYMPFLRECAVTARFNELEAVKYRYKPKRLSNDLYGTTELWSALLELNYMVSIIDFNLESPIKVFEPRRFKELLNEVMIMEGILR